MLKLIGWTIRTALFAALVLVLGNWIKWKGTTLSDHLRVGMSQVERKVDVQMPTASSISEATRNLIKESKTAPRHPEVAKAPTHLSRSHDQISRSDRREFRDFLRELSTHPKKK